MRGTTVWLLTEQVGDDETAPHHALGAFSTVEAARRAIEREIGYAVQPPPSWVPEPWGGGRMAQTCTIAWLTNQEVIPLVFRLVPFFLDQPCAEVGMELISRTTGALSH